MALILDSVIPWTAQEAIQAGAARGWADALQSYSEERRSPNYWRDPTKRRVRCVVWHITDGGFTSSIGWLCNPESDASANDLINRDGKVWNLLRGTDAPWTNGPLCKPDERLVIPRQAKAMGVNPNWWSYTIESVGMSTYGKAGALTNAQIAALILRTAQACVVNRLTADHEHILRHSTFDSCDRSGCPGFALHEYRAWTDAVLQVCRHWRGW